MNNKVKKLVATSLVSFTAFTAVPSAALADNTEAIPVEQLAAVLSDEKVVSEMTLYAIEKNNIDLNECSRLKAIFDTAYANKDIVFEAGRIVVKESLNEKISTADYNKIISDMILMNDSIESGIVSFNQSLGLFTTVDLATVVNNISANNNYPTEMTASARISNFPLGRTVSSNYAYIEDYFTAQMSYNPSNAYTATVTAWVLKVREYGDWDYKRVYPPQSTPFNCTYGLNGSKTAVKTSEFIGNYNYGYTGSLLFNLSVLKTGSMAVAGFDPSDYDDHPAIEEGFSDANLIE